jgi:hypothetical protein
MPSWAIYGNERFRGPGPQSVEGVDAVAQFLARISDPGAPREALYTTLIEDLVSEGIWPKLQALYIFAAADQATALTNLKSSSFAATNVNTTAFAADDGFTGTDGGTTHINTGYNNNTNGSLDDQHIMAWNGTNGTSLNPICGAAIVGTDNQTNIYPKYTADNFHYGRVNNDAGSGGVAVADPTGSLIASRTGPGTLDLYHGGVNVGIADAGSGTPPNLNIYFCAQNADGTAVATNHLCRAGSIGTGLTAAQALAFHNILNNYMTQV